MIININFHNTNHYTQLLIQSNHFLQLKNIYFNFKNSTPKHNLKKKINSIYLEICKENKNSILISKIQHPNTPFEILV